MFHLIQPERRSHYLVQFEIAPWLTCRERFRSATIRSRVVSQPATGRFRIPIAFTEALAALSVPFIGAKVAVEHVLVADGPPSDDCWIDEN